MQAIVVCVLANKMRMFWVRWRRRRHRRPGVLASNIHTYSAHLLARQAQAQHGEQLHARQTLQIDTHIHTATHTTTAVLLCALAQSVQ